MRCLTVGAAVSLLFLTAACTGMGEPLSPTHGAVAKANFEAMVDDPRPVGGDPVPDARVIDGAIDRYQQDEVKQPHAPEGYSGAGSGEG